jgi:hypothetical protein
MPQKAAPMLDSWADSGDCRKGLPGHNEFFHTHIGTPDPDRPGGTTDGRDAGMLSLL